MATIGKLGVHGNLAFKVNRCPKASIGWRLRNALTLSFIRGWIAWHVAKPLGKFFGFATIISKLEVKLHRVDGSWVDYGLVSYRVVTTAFVNALAVNLYTPSSPSNYFYHALGIGTGAEAIGDTGMGTELTTEYTGDVRATGTHVSGGAGTFQSVATNTLDGGTPAVTEHGVMSAASGAATLMDRHKFAAINMVSGDSLVTTYTLTLSSGG
jgi:hypothetical protein